MGENICNLSQLPYLKVRSMGKINNVKVLFHSDTLNGTTWHDSSNVASRYIWIESIPKSPRILLGLSSRGIKPKCFSYLKII